MTDLATYAAPARMNNVLPAQAPVQDFNEKLTSFVAGCQDIINTTFAKHFDRSVPPKLEIDPKGIKFVKIVSREERSTGGSVFCFVDRTNGDVLKAASWQKPAKHARGNIFDEYNGLSRIKWTGPEYLK